MANFTELENTIAGLFDVIGVLITEFTQLVTGDFIVLVVVLAVVGFIISLIGLLFWYLKSHFNGGMKNTMNMKK